MYEKFFEQVLEKLFWKRKLESVHALSKSTYKGKTSKIKEQQNKKRGTNEP